MAKYFTIHELTRSNEAIRRGIDNTPPPDIKIKLVQLMDKCLDPIREAWGEPIIVNSGFRCPALNTAVSGVSTSQHKKGEAADITAGSVEKNKELFKLIADLVGECELSVDQCIDESGYRWIHVSYKNEKKNRNNFLHL